MARHPVRRAAGRGAFWVLRIAVVAGVAVAVAPVTLVALGAAGAAVAAERGRGDLDTEVNDAVMPATNMNMGMWNA